MTVSNASASTFVTLWPSGTKPSTSNVNAPAGTTVQNTAVVELSATGSIQVFNNAGTATIGLYVQGYFVDDGAGASGGFVPVEPDRLLDTRKSTQIPAGGSLDVKIADTAGVPADASSVFVNVMVVSPDGSGSVGIFKRGVTPIGAGPVFFAGATTAQAVNVAPDVDGFATVQNFSTTVAIDVVVDVQGYFTGAGESGGAFTPTTTRILDTRTTGGQIQAGTVRTVDVAGVAGLPADGIGAVFANVITVAPQARGGLHVWNPDEPEPTIDNVRYPGGVSSSALLATKVSADGKVAIGNRGAYPVQVVIDIQGWFTGTGSAVKSEGGEYRALQPVRIVDTRNGLGGYQGTIGAGASKSFKVTGVAGPGVPASGVSAVAVTVTATDASADSLVTVWPTGQPRPSAAQLSVTQGKAVANTVIAKVGAGGQVDVYNATGALNVIVDVQGYFTDTTVTPGGGTFVATDATRIYDTRSGLGGNSNPLTGGQIRDVQVAGQGGVPATGVSAVAVNVTVTDPTTAAGVQVFPAGGVQPGISSLQTQAGRNMSALVQVKLGTGTAAGKISVFANSGQMALIVDVAGYYLDNTQSGRDLFVPINPQRIYTSTTDWTSGATQAIKVAGAKNSSGDVVVPATGATAVVLSVTATDPDAAGFLTVWPAASGARPGVSTMSYASVDAAMSATVITKLGPDGYVNVYVNGGTPGIRVDVQGYYQAPKLPPVVLAEPTLIHATGPDLSWSVYDDPSNTSDFDDLVEYQVHRGTTADFTPSAATLLAPVEAGVTNFTDTTATPTPANDPNPTGAVYFYRVVVKTKGGQLTSSAPLRVALPKAGQAIRVLQGPQAGSGATDTTLTANQPAAGHDVLDGQQQLMVGNESTTYGRSRALLRFDTSAIPAGAIITGAELSLFTVGASDAAGATYQVHALTGAFTESATWNTSNGTTAWTTAGGDYTATPAASATGVAENPPAWQSWQIRDAVRAWQATPSSNHGLLVKLANETTPIEGTRFASSESGGSSAGLAPKLAVTYLEQSTSSAYYAPYTPSRMIPGDTYTVDVTVSNPTGASLPSADWVLSYRWRLPDGTDVTTAGNQVQTPLPGTLVSGGTVTVPAQVKTPIQSDAGNKRTEYVLGWELFNKTTGKWLSETATQITALQQSVAVEDPTSNQLGLEKFYSYTGQDTGAGSAVLTNMAAGNAVWSYDVFSNPSRGLATFLRLAYNSQDTSDSGAGFGWSLQPSSPTRLGTPLDFHPNPNPTTVTLTDGDGTSHTFTKNATSGVWEAPAGVHMFLQELVDCAGGPGGPVEDDRAWLMTRPDRTQFFYDCDGYLSAIVDNNGNLAAFTYEQRQSANKPTKFLKTITDPVGRTTLTLDYFEKGESYTWIDGAGTEQSGSNLTDPDIIDHVQTVTDISGRAVSFTYSDKGLLAQLVDGAGDPLAKTFGFGYDATQGNKNVKLVSVVDPRGNDTRLGYYDRPEDDPTFKWWAKTVTDRLDHATSVAYTDPDGSGGSQIQAVVEDAEQHDSTYLHDGFGLPVQTTNARNQVTKFGWDADNNLTRLEEAANPTDRAVTTWTYDQLTGYPTEQKDAKANANGTSGTSFAYQRSLDGHIAELTGKTSPEGRSWVFGYTPEGDLASVTDPAGIASPEVGDYTTRYGYNELGELLVATDANGHATNYSPYDVTGYPLTITDPLGNETSFVYNRRGGVNKVTDAYGKNTLQEYDLFLRPGKHTEPKDQAAGQLIVTPAPVYDAGDNITQATAPNGAVSTAVYDAADRVTSSTMPKDNTDGPARTTAYTYDNVGNLKTVTEPKGTLTTGVPDDYTTSYDYDEIYQLTSATDADGGLTTYGYDNVGNLTLVVDPRKNATPDPADYTTTYAYNVVHQPTTVTDAAGKTVKTGYDNDGLVTSTTDAENNITTYVLDDRGKVSEVRVPHKPDAGSGVIQNTTRYTYDQVGNTVKVTSPRGVATTGVANDFVAETVYDELNRVKKQLTPFNPSDPTYNTANETVYSYDNVGRLAKVSAPPSQSQTVRNDITFSYFDNGWTKSSADAWDITTAYDYNPLGQQISRTLTPGGSSGDDADRTMGWSYYPDGKLAARSDDGVPAGVQVVLADNSDTPNTTVTGTWATGSTASEKYGPDYRTHTAGAGTDTFTWKLRIPQDGTYQVYVRYPQVTGAATAASYTVTHAGGNTAKTVNQTTNTGQWVSLGSYTFTEASTGQKVSLAQNTGGVVAADAIKLVRDNTGDADSEKIDFSYAYDPNGNLTNLADTSPSAVIDAYTVTYTELNQPDVVTEKAGTTTRHTTNLDYDPNGNLAQRVHDGKTVTYDYDGRDLLSKVTDPKITAYTYTARGQRLLETKPNGNTVDYTYYLDGRLHTQTEKKPGGAVVASHVLSWDPNGNRAEDIAAKMNADNHAATLNTTSTYTYDPLDRIAQVTKTGTGAGVETYTHDANNNVVSQTVDGTTTSYTYDRNRLQAATVAGSSTAAYNYDPYGRLDTVTGTAGGTDQVLEAYRYDGFDRITTHRKLTGTGTTAKTSYVYDPLDRTTSKTTNAGTPDAKTASYDYLGLSEQLLTELNAAGEAVKSYSYDAYGQRLYQTTHDPDGTNPDEDTYYSYTPHTDVETLTNAAGDTKATYGYTAYGNNDDDQFTGIDKPDAQDPTKEPYNPYRYTAKRYDPTSGTYDMGFRDYSPNLNRFLTRDTYNGALNDLNLTTNPYTGNRYNLAAGNPITRIELDGHYAIDESGAPLPPASARTASDGGDIVLPGNRYYTETYTENVEVTRTTTVHVNQGVVKAALSFAAVAPLADGPFPAGDAAAIGAVLVAGFAALAAIEAGTTTTVEKVERTRLRERPLTYVTYTKEDPVTGEIYAGRTRGYGTPQQIVAARDRGHVDLKKRGFLPAEVDRSLNASMLYHARSADPAYHAIRGREQQLIDAAGGAISDARRKGASTNSANNIRGVSPYNPMGWLYHQAASAAFGQIAPYTGYFR
ncbi:golvesin C-terminal-like domain-containing protein [Flindersiella endophytica]